MAAASAALFGAGELAGLDESTLFDAVAELPVADGWDGMPLLDALVASGLATSKGSARRSVSEGAVHVNNVKVVQQDLRLDREQYLHGRVVLLRRGRRTLSAVRLDAGPAGIVPAEQAI